MLPRNHPDRIQIAFDDHRLVANAGLLLPVTLAQHLGLREVVDSHVDLGDAPGRANPGDKLLSLVASALAGGDFIDDADVLRTGGTAGAIGCVVKAPSTLGTFLRSFRWGHVRQLDRVSRELLSRAWAAGAGPGEGPLTIDLDSTMCETYGLAKEGARHHGYTGQRGYHPLLAIAAGTGDVLMSRLREGRANTVRGAAHFLRETVGRVRHAGATGQLTVRADSGFYAHALVVVCREMDVRFSITIRQHARLRELIEAIPEEDWTPVPYWMDGGADVAETTYTPFQGEPEAAPVRLIVRRVKPTPGSQLALFASYSYHGFITDRDGETLELEADHRRHAEIENAIRDLKHGVGLNHFPSGRFPANGAWLAVQVLAHNLARWTAHRSGRGGGDHQDPPAALLLPGRTAHPLGPPPHFASATGLALGNPVHSRPGSIASPAIACLTAPTAPDTSTRLLNHPTESHRPGPRLSSLACCPADPAPAPLPRTAIGATNSNQRPPPAPVIGIERGPSRPTALTPCSNPKAAPHRWIRAKGGLCARPKPVRSEAVLEAVPEQEDQERGLDRAFKEGLLNGISLTLVGALSLGLHALGRRRLKTKDECEGMLHRGYIILLLVIFGIIALFTLPSAIFDTLRYYILDTTDEFSRGAHPGGSLATAIVSLPVWAYYLNLTVRLLRRQET